MNNIYIGFSSPRKFKPGAEFIKIWTESEFSHCYIRFEQEPNFSVVFHAAKGMVHYLSYENFLKDNKTVHEYPITVDADLFKKIKRDCDNVAGEGYSTITLLKIVMSDIMHTFGGDVSTYDDKGYICSELVGKLLTNRFRVIFSKPMHLLTPKDIYNKLIN